MSSTKEILDFLVRYNVAVLTATVFIDQIGLPLPSVPWLLAAGALAANGYISLIAALIASTLAAVAADLIWFSLGRYYGESALRFLYRVLPSADDWVRKAQQLITRYSMGAIVLAKFVPVAKTLMPALAGNSSFGRWRFLMLDGLGSLIHGSTFVILGMLFSEELDRLMVMTARHSLAALVIACGLVALYSIFRLRRRSSRAIENGSGH